MRAALNAVLRELMAQPLGSSALSTLGDEARTHGSDVMSPPSTSLLRACSTWARA